MEQYGDMLAGAGILAYLLLVAVLALIAWVSYRYLKRKKEKPSQDNNVQYYEDITRPATEDSGEVAIGHGNYQCICFRHLDGKNVADFTRITKAVGELYQFDTSCPHGGSGYIVREDDNSNIVDYDPRQQEYVIDESPEYAWFAITWDIVKQVFFVPVQWYKSTTVWFAVGMMAITFVVSLAVIG